MKNDPELEELALCYIMQRGTVELFSEQHFTEERQYLFCLLQRTMDKYKCLDSTFCNMMAEQDHDDILHKVRQNYPQVLAVPFYTLEPIFQTANDVNNTIKQDAARSLVPLLSSMDKQRSYEKAVQVLYDRVKRGEYTPLDDVIELEKFTTSTDYEAKDFIQRYDNYKNEEPAQIITTGEPWLDDKASIIKGNITVIAGDTGSMKTTSALWLIIKILQANPTYKAVFFEKEMPIADIMSKVISFFTKVPTGDIIANKTYGTDAMDKMLAGQHSQSDVCISILQRLKLVDTNEFDTIEDMLNFIESEQADIWCLDFLTQMFSDAENASAFNYKVMTGMNKIKRIVQRTGSTGIILCQLKKGTVEHRLLKVPLLDDMEWSGTIKQLANNVYMTFYPQMYYSNLTGDERQYFYLINVKNRFGSRYKIPFIAFPAVNTLKQPENNEPNAWLDAYITKFSQF